MRGSLKRGLAIILATLTLTIPSSMVAFGQASSGTGNGFRLSPVRSEYTIEKGKSTILTITIENPTDASITAQAEVNDFISSTDETGEPRLILDDKIATPKNSFKDLVDTLPDVTLGPREKKDLQITIRVPDDAGAGGYYGAIRFTPASAPGSGNVGLTASVGSIILVRVPGNLTERLDLEQLSAAKGDQARSFFLGGDVSVLTRLKNTGDIHVQPFGKVQVKNMFGKVIHEFELNNTQPRANILPDSIRKFVDQIPKQHWFGRYTIEANIGYSQGTDGLVSDSVSFWYIPGPILLLLVLLVLAVVAAVYWFIRKTKAKHQHKHDVNKQHK